MPHNSPRPSRRAVAKGAAWSVPVVAAAVAAPAASASPLNGCTGPVGCPTVSNHGYVTESCGDYTNVLYTVNGTRSALVTNPGLMYTGTTSKSTVLTPVVTFFFPVRGLVWSSSVAPCPPLTSNGRTKSVNGVTYYGYSSTFPGAVLVSPGSTVLPYYFVAQKVCPTSYPPLSFIAQSSSMLNGLPVTTDSGVKPIN